MSDYAGAGVKLKGFSVHLSLNSSPIPFFSKPRELCIVQPISIFIAPSSLFAILGGSGSGKTTLLNCLAGRFDKSSYKVSGSVDFGSTSCIIGYVTQNDFLLPYLTVRETLLFTAKLKVVAENDEAYETIVRDVIMDLGLKECTDSRIGDNHTAGGVRGLSGGEKRRVSVALQIITNPNVLCADEPTSGLDSFTAVTVMESLKRLTNLRNTTVICSVHQPRADIFSIFDYALLLGKGGCIIYCGPTSNMVNYFAALGHRCPDYANPADFFVDLSSVDTADRETKRSSLERVQILVAAYGQQPFTYESDMAVQQAIVDDDGHQRLSIRHPSDKHKPTGIMVQEWFLQFRLLCGRFIMNDCRDLSNLIGGLLQAMCLGIVLMGIFWQLGDSSEDVQSRTGLLYIDVSMESYLLMIILIDRYCREMKIFDRELQDDLYSPSAYMIAHIVANLPLMAMMTIFYSVPIYFGCGLRSGSTHFLLFLIVNFTLFMVINGLVWMGVAMDRRFAVASLISNISFTFISISAGFLVNSASIPVYVRWVKNISVLSYAYNLLMENEFQDRTFTSVSCTTADECTTNVIEGNNVLSAQSVAQNNYPTSWPVMICIGLVYYTVAMVLLYILRFPPTGAVSTDLVQLAEEENEEGETTVAVDNIAKNGEKEDSFVVKSGFISASNTATPLLSGVANEPSIEEIDINEEESKSSPLAPSSSPAEITINVQLSSLYVMTQTTKTASGLKSKQILQAMAVEIKPSRLVAIMGGSGSGKSTLLNLIANRIPHTCLTAASSAQEDNTWKQTFAPGEARYHGQGAVLFNNRPPSSKDVRRLIGYVQQFDFHLPSLTVLETLTYQARLRLPWTNMTDAQRTHRVHAVLDTLGLRACAHVQVGNDELKGISGGEKRRLSIGIQLLSDPAICLFDEPTSGLDAFTARHIVMTLRDLVHGSVVTTDLVSGSPSNASSPGKPSRNISKSNTISRRRRTVALSIHQPRYDIFACVEDVILLSRGQLVWNGPVSDMLRHLEGLGHPCPALVNPADFILDLSSVDFRSEEREAESKQRLSQLVVAYAGYVKDSMTGAYDLETASPVPLIKQKSSSESEHEDGMITMKPFTESYPILLNREFTNLWRQPVLMFNRITQCLFYALILACFYAPVGTDQAAIQDTIGLLYELTPLCFIGMLNCVAIFPAERDVFYREYLDGVYSSWAFIAAYDTIAIPLMMIAAICIALIVTCAIGIAVSFEAFVAFAYVLFCFIITGESLGVIFGMAFLHIGFSVNIMSAILSFFSIMAGFISLNMPLALIDIAYISPNRWGAYLVSNIAFSGKTYSCTQSEEVNGVCPLSTGDDVLELYGYVDYGPPYGMSYHYYMLGIIAGLYFLVSIVAVRLRALKLSH